MNDTPVTFQSGSSARHTTTPRCVVFLSIWTDPFVTFAYLRRNAHQYNGMSARDWGIFMLALAIGNGYWLVLLITDQTAAEYGWMAITGLE